MSEKLILKPFDLKGKTLQTRIEMPPMATFKSTDDRIPEEVIAYYREKTDGNAIGLCVTEHTYVSPEGKAHPGQISIADDAAIADYQRLVPVLKKNGCVNLAQIAHAGAKAESKVTGLAPMGPSALALNRQQETAIEMTADDIAAVTEAFARAAVRAEKAGFDGIELHGAHGYLINQFFSPITNKRTDRYGGSLENRIRIHLEILRAVKAAVSPSFIVATRFGTADFAEGGATIEESVEGAVMLEEAGADYIDVSGGVLGTENRREYPGLATYTDVSQMIREKVHVPVGVCGRITDALQAEQILEEGSADIVGAAMALLRDSMWARNVIETIRND